MRYEFQVSFSLPHWWAIAPDALGGPACSGRRKCVCVYYMVGNQLMRRCVVVRIQSCGGGSSSALTNLSRKMRAYRHCQHIEQQRQRRLRRWVVEFCAHFGVVLVWLWSFMRLVLLLPERFVSHSNTSMVVVPCAYKSAMYIVKMTNEMKPYWHAKRSTGALSTSADCCY